MRDRLKYVWLLLIAICLFYFYKKNMFFGNPLELRVWLANFGAMTPAIFVILYTLRPILLIPALLLNLMSAALFGPVWGTVYTLLGGLGSATLCYYLARYSKFEFIANVADKWWSFVDKYTPAEHFPKMLCLRLVPIFPYDPISFLAGLSNIPYRVYALATLLGMIPGAIAYNFLVDNVLANKSIVFAISFMVVAFVLPYLYWQQKIFAKASK